MAQILIRGLQTDVIEALKQMARQDKRSLQSEVKSILEQAAHLSCPDAVKLANFIRRKFKQKKFSNSVELIREDRDL